MANVEYKIEGTTPQRKNKMTVFVAFLAVVVLIAGGTLAYLTTTTNQESNVFTAGNIKAQLIEATWTAADPADGTSGSEIAQNMLPGVIAPKDPLIKNISGTDISEWTGLMLTFEKPATVDVDGTPLTWTTMTEAEVANLLIGVGIDDATSGDIAAGIALNSNWARIDNGVGVGQQAGKRVYAFNAVIADTASTDALFKRVGILSTAGSADDPWVSGTTVTIDNFMTWLNAPLADGGLAGNYRITIDGAAVQDDGVQSDANNTILGLFGFSIS